MEDKRKAEIVCRKYSKVIHVLGGRRNFSLQSEDPQNLAVKDKAKQDYQRELRDQIEAKKRMKEQEKQKQREEDRLEEERMRKEQETLARRQAEEDSKTKSTTLFQKVLTNLCRRKGSGI